MAKRPRIKKHPGSIYVRATSKRIYIEYRGQTIATRLVDTKENRKIAEEIVWTLWRRDHGIEAPSKAQTYVRHGVLPSDLWLEYRDYLRDIDRAEKTITAYSDAFEKMMPATLSVDDIEAGVRSFVRSWTGAPSSINIHLRNYSPFLKWCKKQEYITEVPDLSAYIQRGVYKDVQVLAPREIEMAVEILRDKQDTDLADLVELMYYTGLRVTEAMMLKRSQYVDLEGVHAMRMQNKVNHKPEYIPISRILQAVLDRRPKSDNLFPWQPSASASLTRRFNRALLEAGVVGKTGFHLLRKSFRHRLQMAGVSLDAARRLMRHSSLKVTDEHYTLYQTTELAEILDAIQEGR